MQSTPLHRGRAELEERAARLERQYADESVPVPRPPHWGGFILRPLSVEFWQVSERSVRNGPLISHATVQVQSARRYPSAAQLPPF
jgi:pyridoxine/pyridoxamine 5'-phosphate oxidase